MLLKFASLLPNLRPGGSGNVSSGSQRKSFGDWPGEIARDALPWESCEVGQKGDSRIGMCTSYGGRVEMRNFELRTGNSSSC